MKKYVYLAIFAHSNEVDEGIERENGVFDVENALEAVKEAESFAEVYFQPKGGSWRVAELVEVLDESEAHARLAEAVRRDAFASHFLRDRTSDGRGGGFSDVEEKAES